jgi:hypothetical protein
MKIKCPPSVSFHHQHVTVCYLISQRLESVICLYPLMEFPCGAELKAGNLTIDDELLIS